MCDLPELAALTLANFYFMALAFVSASFFGLFFVLHLLKKTSPTYSYIFMLHSFLGCIFTPFHAPCSFWLARRTRTQAELERMTRIIC